MGQAERAVSFQIWDQQSLRPFENHYISAEFHKREDIAVRQVDLARIISKEIVPRLLRIHTEVVPDAPTVDVLIETLAPSLADVSALAHIILGDDLAAAANYVTVLRDRGLPMETLYVELLEPTARFLGTMWDNDECDFVDVTIGVARLQKLLAIFNDTYFLPDAATRRQVLMATAPGNQHSFGVNMIERLLTAAGWQVQTEFSSDAAQIVDAVREGWFAVIGLTAGSDLQLDGLTSVIRQIRLKSQNPSIGIMVGGPMFTQNPGLAFKVGADATAPNAPTAVLCAQKLFDDSVRGAIAHN